ncbi:MAG: hypothetical protein EKK40_18870 [Bradyrhizobiaceae bacterium]|nr:MAG: hypothetical protein EKK40_18870 [Bradyrhizobiaceae bacterium]
MDKDVARHMIRAGFRCSRELQDVMLLLKGQMPEDAYAPAAHRIAAAMAAVGDALTATALAAHPELEAEIESSLARYDRYL